MEKEQMMERIIELEQLNKEMSDQNASLKIENETFRATINTHEEKINELKRMNMRYFERLTMESKPVMNEQPPVVSKTEEAPKTWDEFLNEW